MVRVDEVFKKILFQQSLSACDLEQIKANYPIIQDSIRNYRFSEHENWGIQYQPNLHFFELSRLESNCKRSSLDDYLCKFNWRYALFSPSERETFCERLYSIKYDVLLNLVQEFIREQFGDYRVIGLSIFGGVLYGHENQVPGDIDLILLLEGANFTANPVSLMIPDMERLIFYPGAPRPVKSGKVGLTIVGTKMINPLAHDEIVKEFSLVYWGESVPIYGNAFCNQPPPPLAHLSHPYRLMAWAYKDLLMNQTDAPSLIRSLSRVIIGVYVALFIIDRLHLDDKISMSPKDIWTSIYVNPQPGRLIDLYIQFSRELSKDLHRLENNVKDKLSDSLGKIDHED